MNYTNVVRENQLEGFNNPLQNILSGIFTTERKLKPIVKQREAEGFSEKREITINCHIVRGENIPLRHNFVEELL
jgi:hypothetical protein